LKGNPLSSKISYCLLPCGKKVEIPLHPRFAYKSPSIPLYKGGSILETSTNSALLPFASLVGLQRGNLWVRDTLFVKEGNSIKHLHLPQNPLPFFSAISPDLVWRKSGPVIFTFINTGLKIYKEYKLKSTGERWDASLNKSLMWSSIVR